MGIQILRPGDFVFLSAEGLEKCNGALWKDQNGEIIEEENCARVVAPYSLTVKIDPNCGKWTVLDVNPKPL